MGIIDHPYLDREYDVRGMSFHSVGIQFNTDWPLQNASVRAQMCPRLVEHSKIMLLPMLQRCAAWHFSDAGLT